MKMSEAYISQSGVNRRPQGGEREAMLDPAILAISDVYYTDSRTSQGQDISTGAGYSPYWNTVSDHAMPPHLVYSTEASSAPSPPVYPSGLRYLSGPGYPATSGYLTAGLPAFTRPSTAYSNYTSEDVYHDISAVPSYHREPQYLSAGEYSDPREQPTMYSRTTPKDTRMDPRDPSLELRYSNDPRLDPTDLRADPRDLGKDPKDTRVDTHPDSRTVPRNFTNVTSPGDVSMHVPVDDPRSYHYVPSSASILSDKIQCFEPDGDGDGWSTAGISRRKKGQLQPSNEKSDARHDEEPIGLGLPSLDDNPVCQESHWFTCSLHYSRLIFPFPKLSSTTWKITTIHHTLSLTA